MMFVSVEQGDITFYWVSVFEKVYLGITTATKTCYQKKGKKKPGTKTVEKCWNFLQLSSFFIFSQFLCISSPPVLEGGSGSYSLSISVSWFVWFSSIRPSSSGEMPRMLKKTQIFTQEQLRGTPLLSYILIKSGRYFLSISSSPDGIIWCRWVQTSCTRRDLSNATIYNKNYFNTRKLWWNGNLFWTFLIRKCV